MTDEEKDYIVYSVKFEKGAKRGQVYFWSGVHFTGDIKKAKIHPRYVDCIDTIWRGRLDKNIEKLHEMGFGAIRAIPLSVAQKEIRPGWCGEKIIYL